MLVSGDSNEWFWGPVNDFGLAPLLKTRYDNITYGLVYDLSERWHEDTSSFHLSVGEVSVTLEEWRVF